MEQNMIRKIDSFPLVFAAGTTIALVALKLFRWELMDLLTVFLEPLAELGVIACFLISLVLSAIHFIKTVRVRFLLACAPVVLNLAALTLAITIPFLNYDVSMDDLKKNFDPNLGKREKIVSMIQSGELQPNVSHNANLISLPLGYKYLSRGGGEVLISRQSCGLKVLFYTFRGVLDNYSGFIYTSDGKVSANDFQSEFLQIEKMNENWYWASSH